MALPFQSRFKGVQRQSKPFKGLGEKNYGGYLRIGSRLCHFYQTNPFFEFAMPYLSMRYKNKEPSRHKKRTHYKPNRTHFEGEQTHFKATPYRTKPLQIEFYRQKVAAQENTRVVQSCLGLHLCVLGDSVANLS